MVISAGWAHSSLQTTRVVPTLGSLALRPRPAMPVRLRRLIAALLLTAALPAAAQVTDDFSDGDFANDPAWTGTTDRWTVALLDGDFALRTAGLAQADTIFLVTPSVASRGTWSFRFAFQEINLSTFNGARIFLTADAPDLLGDVRGYYLQLGTNNTDEIRLYRLDGDPAETGNRVLLARSESDLLDGEAGTFALDVSRDADDTWTVRLDGTTVLEAADGRHPTSRFFGFWVKHSAAGADAFFFDDVHVDGEEAEADLTPPALLGVEYQREQPGLDVTFSEPLDAATVQPAAFEIDGLGPPAGASLDDNVPARVRLALTAPLAPGGYVLRVRGVADRAGNVLDEAVATFEVAGQGPSAQPGDVVVNEIFYDPPASGLEFVEVVNRSTEAFELGRFQISDARRQPVGVDGAAGMLPPGGFVVFAQDSAAFAATFPGVAFLVPTSWPALNNGGDTAVLWFDDAVLDSVAYRPSWGGEGVSLERLDPDGPSTSRFNFGSSEAEGGATPGARNSRFAPDRTPPGLLFAEQVAAADVDVFLSEPLDPVDLLPSLFALDDGRRPARLIVLDPDATWLRLRFTEPPNGVHLTARGLRDLTGNLGGEATVPLAFLAEPGELVVNEILFDPRADRFDERSDQPEYVEILNGSGRTLTLRRHALAGREDEEGHADTLALGTDFLAVPPDGFAVIFADPEADGEARLVRAFPSLGAAPGDFVLVPLARTTLGLGNDGDRAALLRGDGLLLDEVTYDPAWHHPALRETAGVALERLAADHPAADPANWTSSVAPEGGTPGQPNSVGLRAQAPAENARLVIDPSPFSPDRDGFDDVTALRYRLDTDVSVVRVRIFDQHGRLVRTLEEAVLAGRTGQLLWDGLDDGGRRLRLGVYVVLFEAFDAEGGTAAVFKEPVVLARRLD